MGTPINGGHASARGLLAYYAMDENAGSPREGISRRAIPNTSGPGGWILTALGSALGGVTGTYDDTAFPHLPVAYPFTLHIVARPRTGDNGTIRQMFGISDGSTQYGIGFTSTAGVPRLQISGSSLFFSASSGITLETVGTASATFDTQASRTIYVNGLPAGTETTDVGAIPTFSRVALFSTSGTTFGDLIFAALWNRSLPPGELKELTRMPYDLFIAPMRRAVKRAAAVASTGHGQLLLGHRNRLVYA